MPFETPITIREAIQRIQRREYLLPGIQRELVWVPDQMCQLFDSLLRGYPIGSFLFWQVDEAHKADYKFYEFIRDFHSQDGRHNPKANLLPAGGLTAILDGQQRLTSLYIGLLGTYTERRKYARRGAASSYSKRRLYLNLSHPSEDDPAGYDFRFLEADEDFFQRGDDFWYRVGGIMSFKQTIDVVDFLIEHELTQKTNLHPKKCLVELHKAVTELPLINYFTEVEQGLDRVLQIFIRVNSGGTELSYSDLLLSIASAQWEERDARQSVHDLVDEINTECGEFSFPRDFVLKCCLMLADVDLRWKVANFNQANMRTIESLWPKIEEAIRVTAITLSGFGFTGKTLASTNAVLPIVYYIFQRGSPAGFAEAGTYRADRETIHRWLNIVLLKQTFGGNPDDLLRRMREIIRGSHAGFPAEQIAASLEATPYTLTFRKGELETLLDGSYGGPYTFPLLAMLYPALDFRNKFHQDHIHPKSHFTPAELRARGIPEELRSKYLDRVNLIPNLQLLEGQPNVEKSAKPFADWLEDTYAKDPDRLADYLKRNFIPADGFALDQFLDFFARRRQRMLDALRHLIGESAIDEAEEDVEPLREKEVAGFHGEVVAAVASHLKIDLTEDSQTCFTSANHETHVVCVVSKRYARGQLGRYWYAIRPHQVEYASDCGQGFFAFGCGGPGLTLLVPAPKFIPLLEGMRQTIDEEDGRSYWHVELFGDREHLELGQSLLNKRTDVSALILPIVPKDP